MVMMVVMAMMSMLVMDMVLNCLIKMSRNNGGLAHVRNAVPLIICRDVYIDMRYFMYRYKGVILVMWI